MLWIVDRGDRSQCTISRLAPNRRALARFLALSLLGFIWLSGASHSQPEPSVAPAREGSGVADRGPGRCRAGATALLTSSQLIQMLRHGGYLVVLRHEEKANRSHRPQNDRPLIQQCVQQAEQLDRTAKLDWKIKLTRAGRRRAESLGDAIGEQSVPIGIVYSSEYCRTIETGILAFGDVKLDRRLNKGAYEIVGFIKELESDQPAVNVNHILLSHSTEIPFLDRDNVEHPIRPAEAFVVNPRCDPHTWFLGRIERPEWDEVRTPAFQAGDTETTGGS